MMFRARMAYAAAAALIVFLGTTGCVGDLLYENLHMSPDLRRTLINAVISATCAPGDQTSSLRVAQGELHTRRDRAEYSKLEVLVRSCAAVADLTRQQEQRQEQNTAVAGTRVHRQQLMVMMEEAYLLHGRLVPSALQNDVNKTFAQDASNQQHDRTDQEQTAALITSQKAQAAQRLRQLRSDLRLDAPIASGVR